MKAEIDHIAIVVENLDEALKVYHGALDLPLERIEEVQQEQVKVAFLPLPQGSGRLELVQPITEDSGVAKYMAKRGEGIHHLTLLVENLDETIALISAQGLRVLSEKPKIDRHGQRYIFIHPKTTHGVLLELYEQKSEIPSSSLGDRLPYDLLLKMPLFFWLV